MKLFSTHRTNFKGWGIDVTSGGDEDDQADCRLNLWWPGRWSSLRLPPILWPHREKVLATYWTAETIARMGRDWYYNTTARVIGISYADSYLHLRYGRSTNDSLTNRSWCKELPWLAYRFTRFRLFNAHGLEFWDSRDEQGTRREKWDAQYAMTEACPKVRFYFNDFDGEMILATTHIEERSWERGTGWFTWLSWIFPTMTRRSLDITFSKQVGPRKGSWKGGTLGHSIEMLGGELHYGAFKRYAAKHKLSSILPVEFL